jgi:hypothetical protein
MCGYMRASLSTSVKTSQCTSASYFRIRVRFDWKHNIGVDGLTLEVFSQSRVEHKAELIAKVPLLLRLHQVFSRALWYTLCIFGISAEMYLPKKLIVLVAAERGDRGSVVCFDSSFKTDAVEVQDVCELVAIRGRGLRGRHCKVLGVG